MLDSLSNKTGASSDEYNDFRHIGQDLVISANSGKANHHVKAGSDVITIYACLRGRHELQEDCRRSL